VTGARRRFPAEKNLNAQQKKPKIVWQYRLSASEFLCFYNAIGIAKVLRMGVSYSEARILQDQNNSGRKSNVSKQFNQELKK
jgi:hypothetical protein